MPIYINKLVNLILGKSMKKLIFILILTVLNLLAECTIEDIQIDRGDFLID